MHGFRRGITSRQFLQSSSILSGSSPRLRYDVQKQYRCGAQQRRSFAGLPSVLVPPVMFLSLAVALWTWKCLMMVVFQNKIIYMPGFPPNARLETIADYKGHCAGIEWREERIRSGDRTRTSLCVANVINGSHMKGRPKSVYILYFQGTYLSFLSDLIAY